MEISTLSELFLSALQRQKQDCLLHKQGDSYRPVSSSELADRVRRLASGLKQLGLERGDRVALMAENGVHWPTVDFSVLCLGGIVVPIYPTLTSDQAAYIAADCGAKILFVEGRERLGGLLEHKDSMPAVERFVLIGDEGPAGGETPALETLLRDAEPMSREMLEGEARQVRPDDLATFIYTSGTTGRPKGVMLTHRNITSNVLNCLKVMDIEDGWTALSFLPLSHSFERTVDYIYFYRGVSIAYAESVQAVSQNLLEVRPHVFVSVPRVYEKVLARVHESVATGSALKQRIFNWAERTGRQALPFRLHGKAPPGLLALKLKLADRLVFAKIKDRLGGRFRFAISGGAPLGRETAEFFWGAGIRVFEGYGLSETSPVLAANTPERVKLGTVGPPIPEVEIKIAEDQEILARGPNIMKGYHNLPQETAEAIDDDGWFHTGDIGELDPEGFLRITDRKKEIIVNAYGKNVAPAPIENRLKSSRFVNQAVVIGDRRKMLSALIVPDFETLEAWATRQGIEPSDRRRLLGDPRVIDLFRREIESVNSAAAKYEQVRLWELLAEEFTIETGELTPTQKVKRRVIDRKYGDLIERLYSRPSAAG